MNRMLPQNIAEIVVRFVYIRKKGNDKEKKTMMGNTFLCSI